MNPFSHSFIHACMHHTGSVRIFLAGDHSDRPHSGQPRYHNSCSKRVEVGRGDKVQLTHQRADQLTLRKASYMAGCTATKDQLLKGSLKWSRGQIKLQHMNIHRQARPRPRSLLWVQNIHIVGQLTIPQSDKDHSSVLSTATQPLPQDRNALASHALQTLTHRQFGYSLMVLIE